MMNKQKLIDEVETLEKEYLKERINNGKYSEKAKGALLQWYSKACKLFAAYIPKDNADFEEFIKKDSVILFGDLYDDKIVVYNLLMASVEDGQIAKPLNNPEEQINDGPAVFISHSSKDKDIIKSFIDNILIKGFRLDDSQIVCTSLEQYGVEGGNNIPEFICKKISGAKVILAMVSPNYKSSEVCMNEVGAAWALKKDIIQIVLSETNFDNLCWLINTYKALRVNDRNGLDSLEETLCKAIGITIPTAKHRNPCTEDFWKSL